jgi:polar amino acid transport system substrate-binding protein
VQRGVCDPGGPVPSPKLNGAVVSTNKDTSAITARRSSNDSPSSSAREIRRQTSSCGPETEHLQLQVAGFENIIPGIAGGKIDIGESSFTDTVVREKKVDFVNYYVAGIQWASATGIVVDPNNACGLKVAVQATTYQDTVEIPAKSAACVAAGKSAFQKLSLDTQDAAATAVALCQANAFSADSPVTLYGLVQLKGKLQGAGKTVEAAPCGIAVAKNSGTAKAVQAALQSMVDDGSYGKILDKWGVGDGGLKMITINAATKL